MKLLHTALTLAAAGFLVSNSRADTLNLLGTAGTFAVLAGTTVTSSGQTVLVGNLGVSSGTSVTGFPPGSITGGAIYTSDALTSQAYNNALAAYTALLALPSATDLSGIDLGGLTLAPGVYNFAASSSLTGNLTLDFGNASNDSFVFQSGTSFLVAAGSTIQVLNLGSNDSIYFAVGSSATIGSDASLQGYLIAGQSIVLGSGASIDQGSLIALNAAITLDTDQVSVYPAAIVSASTPSAPTPEPASLLLLGTGTLAILAFRRQVCTGAESSHVLDITP